MDLRSTQLLRTYLSVDLTGTCDGILAPLNPFKMSV